MKIIGPNYFPTSGATKRNGYLLLLEPAEGDVCRFLHGACAKLLYKQGLYIQAPIFREWPALLEEWKQIF